MGISKVILNGVTKVDLTSDTVEANKLLSGIKATGADGNSVTGNIASRSSTDLTASGATVTVPAGHYASQASKSVASGTAGTPTATKGTVSNHAVTVTPSVTNTAGYITGGTQTGTAVTVNVAELESGTKTITENGTGISVSGYSTVDVAVSGGGGVAIKHNITITKAGSTSFYFTLNDDTTKHYTLNEEVEFTVGDSIQLCATPYFSHKVYVDDVQVYSSSDAPLTYDYQLPNHDISIELGASSPASFKIVSATKGITQDGIYDVLGYAKADVKVGGYTATITNSTNYYCWVKVNGEGTANYTNGTTFKFYDGDTLTFYLQGTRGGGSLYFNGQFVVTKEDTTHIWTPPVYCDIGIEIVGGSNSYVYVTTEILNVTTNGSYPISGYGYVNVSV